MDCPYCEGSTRVADSRPTQDGIRRRRVCNECKRRFTTYERIGASDIRVIKRGERAAEEFDAEKLVRVIGRVTRGRALPPGAAERLARLVEGDLLSEHRATVHSYEIAELLLTRLRELDPVAYARFAADYIGEDGQLRTQPRADEAGPVDVAQLDLFDPGDE